VVKVEEQHQPKLFYGSCVAFSNYKKATSTIGKVVLILRGLMI